MSVYFSCPHCQKKVKAPARAQAADTLCPYCGQTVRAPAVGLYPGVVIDSMRIERRLGQGSMGEVFLATHLTLNRRVALKVLNRAYTETPEAIERFRKEVRLQAKLAHPNLVTAYTAGSTQDIHYLAMAYVAGETMYHRVKRKGPLEEEEALSVALCVARALRHAWERHHILHRDIKPANIMVDDDGEIKLTDMGLSKSLLEDGEATQTGLLIGTPHYMSPEQVRGEALTDARADIYGLGATLYHMLCGEPPFPLDNVRDILRAHLNKPPPSPRARRPDITEATDRLVRWMLSKSPLQRPADWGVVEAEIEGILQRHFPTVDTQVRATTGETTAPMPVATPGTSPARTGRGGYLLAALVVVALSAYGLWIQGQSRAGATPTPPAQKAEPTVAPTPIEPPREEVAPPPEELPPRVRMARSHLPGPMRDIMLELDRAAAPLIKGRRWAEAAAIYRDYDGPMARETERPRMKTAARLERGGEP